MGKTVLITGAARRIGATCVRLLHRENCNLLIHYRASADDAQGLCAELNGKREDSVRTIQADLLDMNDLERLANAAGEAWGGVDVLINNASTFCPGRVDEVTERHWDELTGSNLKAPFFLAKLMSAGLAERRGCIVNIVDIHAERGLPGYPVYSIAKAGLAAMTRVLAKELGPDVRVNGVAPGAILWPENEMTEQGRREILQRVALKRSGEPSDIAKAVRFLIQDADYMTGQIITVDGGRTLFY
ncbi:MAG: pteridine reductase [Gammaproteobacteria bacterium]